MTVGALLAGIAAYLLWQSGVWETLWELFADREQIQRVVADSGPLAPVVYVSLLVVQALLLPLPAPPLQVAGGYLFGAVQGFLLAWVGILIGGVASFGVSRKLGRRYVVARGERVKRFDRYIQEHGAIIIFVARLVPLVHFDVVSYAAGLSGISFWRFLLATALGMTPSTFFFAYLGEASPGLWFWLSLSAFAILNIAAYAYFRRRVLR